MQRLLLKVAEWKNGLAECDNLGSVEKGVVKLVVKGGREHLSVKLLKKVKTSDEELLPLDAVKFTANVDDHQRSFDLTACFDNVAFLMAKIPFDTFLPIFLEKEQVWCKHFCEQDVWYQIIRSVYLPLMAGYDPSKVPADPQAPSKDTKSGKKRTGGHLIKHSSLSSGVEYEDESPPKVLRKDSNGSDDDNETENGLVDTPDRQRRAVASKMPTVITNTAAGSVDLGGPRIEDTLRDESAPSPFWDITWESFPESEAKICEDAFLMSDCDLMHTALLTGSALDFDKGRTPPEGVKFLPEGFVKCLPMAPRQVSASTLIYFPLKLTKAKDDVHTVLAALANCPNVVR